jgi:regulator of cell morphogenesis and NO signaling
MEMNMSVSQALDPIHEQMTVNEAVRLYPATVGVFNDHAIDACCGGAAPIREAALRDGADPDAVLTDLKRVVAEHS